MRKVLILGATGLLGSAVIKEFLNFNGEVSATVRSNSKIMSTNGRILFKEFDAENDEILSVARDFGPGDFIVNCVGLVKSHIDETDSDTVFRAIRLNSVFPHRIQEFAKSSGTKVIQIATDCVYSGNKGAYIESDSHDALDVYGKSKSLGEVQSQQFMNIRASIVGPEIHRHKSLFDWVRLQPEGAVLNGFSNHFWNGVPAIHFAKACKAIIESGFFHHGVHHFVPADTVSKHELIEMIIKQVHREDLRVNNFLHPVKIDRTLSTTEPDFSAQLWNLLKFKSIPKIHELIAQIY